jgi:hypothetical protein
MAATKASAVGVRGEGAAPTLPTYCRRPAPGPNPDRMRPGTDAQTSMSANSAVDR